MARFAKFLEFHHKDTKHTKHFFSNRKKANHLTLVYSE